VKPFENNENVIGVAGIDAEPIIRNRDNPFRAGFPRRKVDAGRFGTPVFDGISNQILEKTEHLSFVVRNNRQVIESYAGVVALDGKLEVQNCGDQDGLQIDRYWVAISRSGWPFVL